VSLSFSDIIFRVAVLMMTERAIETSVYYVHLTRLIAREDFIKFTRRESTKTYINTETWSTGMGVGREANNLTLLKRKLLRSLHEIQPDFVEEAMA
jgi:hypothetical protein